MSPLASSFCLPNQRRRGDAYAKRRPTIFLKVMTMRIAHVTVALITAAVLAASTRTSIPGTVHSLPVRLDISTVKPFDLAATLVARQRHAAAASANPWGAYWTSVNPGSGISFATAQVGWRLDGQPYGPGIDDNLGSGVADNGSAWPGTSITATDDGGRTWSTILRVSTGIWGLDLVSPQVGFAVGVTALFRTTDGGKHWTTVGEPLQHSLVWVGFASSRDGYGLTTTGTLVETTDSGSSWTSTDLKVTGTSACFASPSIGYVTSGAGALYATRDGGVSWSVVEQAPPRVEQFVGPWSDLTCEGPNIWLGLRLICAAACGASFPYLIENSVDGGTSWSSTASDWPGASKTIGPIANLAGVGSLPSHGGIVVDLPAPNSPRWAWKDIRVLVSTAPGKAYTDASLPALPESFVLAGDYVSAIRGVSFVGTAGWLYFDYTRAGTRDRPLAEPIVWKTTNGGSTWTVLSTGPKQGPPPPA